MYINTDIIVYIYMDDLAIVAPSLKLITGFISQIKKHFNIKELGLIKDYLGIDIDFKPNQSLKLSQTRYIEKILAKFGLDKANPVYTPIDSKTKLEPNKEQASLEQIKWFQTFIGSLLFLILGTRPDIAYIIIKLSRFTANPSHTHTTIAKRVLRYLKGTKDQGATYTKSGSSYISGYYDTDYAGDTTAKSALGWIFFLAGGPISWKSKLQTIIAQSTIEAEYIAINSASEEAVFIK